LAEATEAVGGASRAGGGPRVRVGAPGAPDRMADDCLAAVPEPPEGQEFHDLLQHRPPPLRAPNATPERRRCHRLRLACARWLTRGIGGEVAAVVAAVQDPVGATAGTPLPREVIAQWFADPARAPLRRWMRNRAPAARSCLPGVQRAGRRRLCEVEHPGRCRRGCDRPRRRARKPWCAPSVAGSPPCVFPGVGRNLDSTITAEVGEH